MAPRGGRRLRVADDHVVREATLRLPSLKLALADVAVVPAPDTVGNDTVSNGPEAEELPPLTSRLTPRVPFPSRLYQGADPNSTDAFHAYLKLPKIEPTHQIVQTADCVGGADTVETWHLVLLQETFDVHNSNESPSSESIIRSLVTALRLESHAAMDLVEQVRDCGQVVIDTCDTRVAAMRKAELLRDRGLVVRIRARACDNSDAENVGDRMESLASLCNGTLRGDCMRLARKMSYRRSASSDVGWRQDAELNLQFVPENPCEAFFAREQQRYRRQQQQSVSARAESTFSVATPRAASARSRTFVTTTIDPISMPSKIRPCLERRRQHSQRVDTCGEQHDVQPEAVAAAAAAAGRKLAKITPIKKEACRLMRIFVLGKVCMVEGTDEEDAFTATIGTRDEVASVYGVWAQLDTDNSGRVDLKEFRDFARRYLKLKRPLLKGTADFGADDAESFVHKLCDKVQRLLLSKKSSFVIEDMMRLMWPAAVAPQLKTMSQWAREMAVAARKEKIPTPPVLAMEEFEGLVSIFQLYDTNKSGKLTFDQLINLGVIHDYQVEKYRREWDTSGDGHLDLLEFCEMMCPAGFRAHPAARVGSLADGRRIIFDSQFLCWRHEDGTCELNPNGSNGMQSP